MGFYESLNDMLEPVQLFIIVMISVPAFYLNSLIFRKFKNTLRSSQVYISIVALLMILYVIIFFSTGGKFGSFLHNYGVYKTAIGLIIALYVKVIVSSFVDNIVTPVLENVAERSDIGWEVGTVTFFVLVSSTASWNA